MSNNKPDTTDELLDGFDLKFQELYSIDEIKEDISRRLRGLNTISRIKRAKKQYITLFIGCGQIRRIQKTQ